MTMTITAAVVLFATIWFMVLFLVLQTTVITQDDEGEVVDGTHASAPVNFRLGKVMWRTTWISVLIFVPIVVVIESGMITMHDIDFWGRYGDGRNY